MTLQDADPGDIPAFLDRRPFVGTYTNLRDFRNCEGQGKLEIMRKSAELVDEARGYR